MRKTQKVSLSFGADAVGAAVEAARNGGLLCGKCAKKSTLEVEMSQSDFCHECQALVMSLLMAGVERQIKQMLINKGLSPDCLQIADD
jgi:hypothetical protein